MILWIKGIKLSSRRNIGILNSDDYYTNDKVIEILKQFEQRNKDFLYADINYIDEKRKDYQKMEIIRWLRKNKILRLAGCLPIPLFIKKVFFDEKFGLPGPFLISAGLMNWCCACCLSMIPKHFILMKSSYTCWPAGSNSSLKKEYKPISRKSIRTWEINLWSLTGIHYWKAI